MLSIGKMAIGQEAYYDNLASEDYYLDGGEPPGQWFGQGAETLGLSDQIESQDFSDLFKGELKGKRLVQESPTARAPGWDLTFSAPKSVSVIFSQADYQESKKLRDAHQAAVEKALAYIEENCGFTRRGKGGVFVEKAKCIFAMFEHGTSRAEQPQLHTHALMINACVRDDGTTGTLKTQKLYQHKMTAGAIYRAELAFQLEQNLGVETIRDGFSFKVAGVSEELCDHFSKRRQEIEGKLKELGLSGAKASAKVALQTRATKGKISRQDLIKEWRETGVSLGWSNEQLQDILGKSQAQPEMILKNQAALAALEGIEQMMEQRSFFTEKDALRFTCEFSQGRGVSADLAMKATEEALQSEEIVSLGVQDGEKSYTTKEHYELEKKFVQDVTDLKEQKGIKVKEKVILKAFEEMRNDPKEQELSAEQEKAARHILEGEGRISTIVGDAGTGKTTMLKPVAKALEKSGYEVRGVALAGKAAEGLQEGSGIKSGTIASLLWHQEKIEAGWNKKEAKDQFNQWVKDKRKELGPLKGSRIVFNPKWTPNVEARSKENFKKFTKKHSITKKTVLVLDEAGMVDTRNLAKLVEITKKAGAKLVGIGDDKQLQAITQGGGFSGMVREVQGAKLTEVFRQKGEEREAVKEMAKGNVRTALDHYAKEGRLIIEESRNSLKDQLMESWAKRGISNPKDNLIIAGVNVDVDELNKRAQDERKVEGYLRGDSIKVGTSNFYQGDRVLFKKKQKKMGVENGSRGTVKGFNTRMKTLSIELDGIGPRQERTRTIPLSDYSNLELGYASTTHSAQGMTVENAHILTDQRMMDLQMSYVQVSRVKNEATIFTTKEEAGEQLDDLVRSMGRDRQKIMAVEMEKRAQAAKEAGQNLNY